MSKQDGFEKRLNEARARQGLDRAAGSSAAFLAAHTGLVFGPGLRCSRPFWSAWSQGCCWIGGWEPGLGSSW